MPKVPSTVAHAAWGRGDSEGGRASPVGATVLALPLVLLGATIAAKRWGGGLDPLIDFGRELYVPWQLARGEVLYRDIAYLEGPLSPYWNALWFSILPVSIRTVEIVNLGVIAAVSALIFALMRRLGDRLVAFSSVAVFLAIFAFNLMGTGANMNWLTPYSHGMTLGVALALLSLWLLSRYERGRGRVQLGGAALATGLALLTKPEIGAASLLALGVGWSALALSDPRSERRLRGELAVLLVAGIAPFLLAVVSLGAAMPWPQALEGALGGWPSALRSEVRGLHFYRWIMGIDDPVANLRSMGESAAVWALGLAPAAVIALALRRPGRIRAALAAGLPLAFVVLAVATGLSVDWAEAFRAVTPFALGFFVYAAWRWWRSRRGAEGGRAALELALSTLALVLLLKILLKSHMYGYGFGLSLPATLLLVLVLLQRIPERIERWGGYGWAFRGLGLAFLGLASLGCLQLSGYMALRKTIPIGAGGDRFRADRALARTAMVASLVDWVGTKLPPDASLLVLPEGVMVNYLTRRINPTRQLSFIPPEVVIFGEDRMLRDLQEEPPDFVALVHRDTREYGLPLFGTDYAASVLEWVRERYVPVAMAGATPLVRERLRDKLDGFEVLRRR